MNPETVPPIRKRWRALTLSNRFVHGRVEHVHRRFRFVTHVGNAKRRAFDFPVAAVDEEALVLHQFLELRHINGSSAWLCAIVYTRERDRLKT